MKTKVLRPFHQQPCNERNDGDDHAHDCPGKRLPAVGLRDRGEQRQEHQLSGGGARGEQAHHEASSLGEPAIYHCCGEHRCRQARTHADNEAPGEHHVPRLCHLRARCHADHHQRERHQHRLANTKAQHGRARERAHETKQHEIEGDGRRDGGAVPAEGVLQGHDQHTGA